MKTVTLDYDTYVKELLREREIGFSMRRNLKPNLEKALKGFRSYDSNGIREAGNILCEILNELEKDPVDQVVK